MNDDVTAYVAKLPPWQVEVCETLRRLVHDAVPDTEERLQYGKPHFLKNDQHTAVIATAKDKVTFMVFNATDIAEVKGVIRSLGKGERKAVAFTEGKEVDEGLVTELLQKTTASL